MASALTKTQFPFTGVYSVAGNGKHKGPTVLMLKRTMKRAGYGFVKTPFDEMDNVFNKPLETALDKAFKDGASGYGKGRWEKLRTLKLKDGSFAVDAFSMSLVKEEAKEPVNVSLKKAREMLAYCRLFSGPYIYGGQHDGSFSNDDPHDGFDCSSSVSFVLWKFGLLGASQAHVSGWFESWGRSGYGKYITIFANNEHVWMRFILPEGYFRFDTSPHGDGPRGPRVRTLRRSESRFVHRHPVNM